MTTGPESRLKTSRTFSTGGTEEDSPFLCVILGTALGQGITRYTIPICSYGGDLEVENKDNKKGIGDGAVDVGWGAGVKLHLPR